MLGGLWPIVAERMETMFCSMCNSVPEKDVHKCDKCGELMCRHIKRCAKCYPTPRQYYDTNAQVWRNTETDSERLSRRINGGAA